MPKVSSGNVVNLMDALRKSMESEPKGTDEGSEAKIGIRQIVLKLGNPSRYQAASRGGTTSSNI